MSSRTWFRSTMSVVLTVVLTIMIALPAGAAPGGGGGKGNGGGQGGPGGGSGGGGQGGDYAELVLIYRDVDGVPITIGPFEGEHGIEHCVQPISAERLLDPLYLIDPDITEPYLGTVVNADGREVTPIPLFGHYGDLFLPDPDDGGDDHAPGTGKGNKGGKEEKGAKDDTSKGGKGGKGSTATIDDLIEPMHQPGEDEEEGGEFCDPLVIPSDQLLLDRLPAEHTGNFSYGGYVREVELERLNLARSPDHVLEQHMKEIQALLESTPSTLVTLDTSGRPVFDGLGIDAGPKLQAIRESLLETGTIPGAEANGYPFPFQLQDRLDVPGQRKGFDEWSAWDLSGFALGGAASKFTPISLDAVSYHDRVMGIAYDYNVPEARQGAWPPARLYSEELDEWFVSYRGFSYDRAATYPGCATYLDPNTREYVVTPYLDATYPVGGEAVAVFTPLVGDTGGVLSNIAGYAQMAEDARSMNYFTHLFSALYMPVADPVGIETCDAQELLAAALNDPMLPEGDGLEALAVQPALEPALPEPAEATVPEPLDPRGSRTGPLELETPEAGTDEGADLEEGALEPIEPPIEAPQPAEPPAPDEGSQVIPAEEPRQPAEE